MDGQRPPRGGVAASRRPGPARAEGGYAFRSRLRGRPSEAAPLPGQRAGEARNAAAVRLRAGQPSLHPRHLAQQERRRALRQGRLRHLPDRLGHGHRRGPLPHAGRLYQRLPPQRRAAGPQADRRREGQPAGILHGRHDERDVHRLAPGVREEPDPAGCGDRLLHARGPAQSLERRQELRRRRLRGRRRATARPTILQSCFTMLSPVRNLLGKPISLAGTHGRREVRRRVPHDGKPGSTTMSPCRARSFATS